MVNLNRKQREALFKVYQRCSLDANADRFFGC
jgi:hypothetical protein